MTGRYFDVVIVGGGIVGCSTAFYLSRMDPSLSIAVIEKDPSYSQASSALSMANVRVQFSLKENILISQYALEVFETFEEEMAVDGEPVNIAHRKEGNLFLYDEGGVQGAKEALELQQSLGCRVEWWKPERVRKQYPLYRPDSYAGGTFGHDDGHIDAYAVLMAYRAKAKSQGVQFIANDVVDLRMFATRVTGVKTAEGERIDSAVVANCAGAWAPELARKAGVDLSVQPVVRQVFAMDPRVKPEGPLPLTNLPSDLYFRTETGGLILVGKSMSEDETGYDLAWHRQRFYDQLWPELVEFVPAFEEAKLMRGWAGLYAVNTFDANAILGPWPGVDGLVFANGFSGHGLQQAPAVGRYISELILGVEHSLDLGIFSPERILDNRPLSEAGIV